ncbi:hypothetical protein [Amycolatopsis alkalitolerans]|uniref:Uncharacterized protein n=1 Tax=Amycolatopsis alkalitolerans TaxID=2547244 RepID=A0A5C4M120_9PSEU|nr:hypothetical protein [Amycolatopsis alkalitolerans]TNC25393.1 hypothetical protein FG385_14995 [Amycolatopsis alkalitolerans]
MTYPSRAQVLELTVSLARPVPGHIVEFGTWKGASARVIRDELWRSRICDREIRKARPLWPVWVRRRLAATW